MKSLLRQGAVPSALPLTLATPRAPSHGLSPSARWIDIGLILCTVIFYFVGDDYLALASTALVAVIFVLSLDLLVGYAGIESLGHAAFFGVGAYSAALFALHVSGDPILGLAVGAAAAALAGLVSGLVILRMTGLTLIMLTLAFASILQEVANTARPVTGGADGLSGYSINPIFGIATFDLAGRTAYIYAAVVSILVLFICKAIVSSPFGLGLRGIKENVDRMRLLGVPTYRCLVVIYTIAAAIAGVAGALSAQVAGIVGTDSLDFLVSGNALIMLILGGAGRLYGGVVGAIVFVTLSDRMAAVDPRNWLFAIGIGLILVVRYAPAGLAGLGDRLSRRRR